MKQINNNNGIGFLGALTILFIGLKLMNIINWSWWLVLSPLWVGTLLVIGIIGLFIWLNK